MEVLILNQYEFQLASHDDIAEIINLYHSLIGTPGCTWNEHYPNKETAEDDINNDYLYVLKMKDEIDTVASKIVAVASKIVAVASIGTFNELEDLTWKPQNPCELMRIGVHPTYQKQGIGTTMVQHIISLVKKQDYDGIRFLVSKNNPAALALYEKNGFERCGEVIKFDIDFYCYQISF